MAGDRHDDGRMDGWNEAVAAELSAVATAVARDLQDLTREIWEVLTRDIPELRSDDIVAKLLDASVEENVATLLHVLEYGYDDAVRAPAAAVEYARRLAQRGVPRNALTRAYRVGHGRFLRRCLDKLAGSTSDHALAAAVSARLVEVSFHYIDRVSEEVIDTYQHERDRWLFTQTALTAARVRDILRGVEIDVAATETTLGYRLNRYHVGVVAWLPRPTAADDGLSRLDRLGAGAARHLAAGGRHLFVPRDESLAWIWVPVAGEDTVECASLERAFDNGDAAVRIATGTPAYGVSGFRQTLAEAERAQNVALRAEPGSRVTTFSDVGAVALLCADMDAARSWVGQTLADLAVDDEPHARLRDTLQMFLHTGSYSAAAERMSMHKNTVQYRVHKAEDALPASIDDRRAELELALRTCQYLGRAVLRPTAG
jgi:hypothetical protein